MPLAARRRGYFFLFPQKKETQRTGPNRTPAPGTHYYVPLHQQKILNPFGAIRVAHGALRGLGSDTSSRNLPAEAAMLGGGYGSQRQKQHRSPKSGI